MMGSEKVSEALKGLQRPKKRKDPPAASSSSQRSTHEGRVKRVKLQDARSILTQPADAALNDRGELDLQAFIKANEFAIKALDDSMRKSRGILNARAFQQLPRELRRRTASHNVKRVPKRLQRKAMREMKEDNTPTVTPNKRKPGTSRGRIRSETAKKLGILAEKKKIRTTGINGTAKDGGVVARPARPKIRRDVLNDPPKPKSKFRKRQINKTWLPTHMWHAKRAKMTEPKNPLWRFAIPVTSTEKSYRPTHRAGGARGAVAWDMSYTSTIALQGQPTSLRKVLNAIGVPEQDLLRKHGEKWRKGMRTWNGWLNREVGDQSVQIAPATIIWCPSEQDLLTTENIEEPNKKLVGRVFVRIHPSAFLELWTELLRLSKMQHPVVHLEDLRFEIGSIDIAGPGSTEALLGILNPYQRADGLTDHHAETFSSLAGVMNPGSLPVNSVLAFSVIDPRLRYPPRSISMPPSTDDNANLDLLRLLSTWPADTAIGSGALFDRDTRFKATRLPSQKSLNRRKALAPPGAYASLRETDPPIPIILFTSRNTSAANSQGSWTLLAPWKCILPIWYGLMHYPLSSGGNPRFGGLDELRQINFEHNLPWFPADFPGTESGSAWELEERLRRKRDWEKRPKGKRVEWASIDLGQGRRGEIGLGWACDFERLIKPPLLDRQLASEDPHDHTSTPTETRIPALPIKHIQVKAFTSLLSSADAGLPPYCNVATICIALTSRGVVTPCARIYRLPPPAPLSDSSDCSSISSTPNLRQQWLSLVRPTDKKTKSLPNPKSKNPDQLIRLPLKTPLPQRIRLLAESLLQNPPLPYPAAKEDDKLPPTPDEKDLIGFVTTGEFNLAAGKGAAIGVVIVSKVVEAARQARKGAKAGRLCIVRNAGEKVGRLARWEPA